MASFAANLSKVEAIFLSLLLFDETVCSNGWEKALVGIKKNKFNYKMPHFFRSTNLI